MDNRVQWESMLLDLIPAQDQGAALSILEKIKGDGQEISDRELATVLFALRLFQSEIERVNGGEVIDPYGFFADHDPLNPEEIDELCMRLNGGGDV